MTKSNGPSRRLKARRRSLDPAEIALWRTVAGSVTPRDGALLPELPSAPTPTPADTKGRQQRPPNSRPSAPARQSAKTPLVTEPDPNQARKVAKGKAPIEATLDLHGYTQAQARAQLERFIGTSHGLGRRVLLVITGKGSSGERIPFAAAPRGILRQRFLEWMEEPGFRGQISAVHQAHQRHGGRGAFYVFLRRTRNSHSKGVTKA